MREVLSPLSFPRADRTCGEVGESGGARMPAALSLLRELEVRRVLSGRILDDGLAADDALFLGIVGQRRLAVELPALVELGRDAVAEARVVRPGQIAVELHDAFSAMASAMATVRRAISACSSSTMRPSTVITPLPSFSGRSKAAMILRANATSAAGGANTSLATAIWSGWISVLPSNPRVRPCTHSRRKPSPSLKLLKTPSSTSRP